MARASQSYNFDNFPANPSWFEQIEDFDKNRTVGTGDGLVLSQLGAAGSATITTDDGGFGVVVLATTASDNKGPELQAAAENFSLVQGKIVDFHCRLQHSIVLTDTWVIGLLKLDTSISHATDGTLPNVCTVTDGVFFVKPEADTSVYGAIRRDSVQAATGSLATLSNATNVTLGFRVEMSSSTAGTGTVTFYVNGVAVGSLTSTTMPYSAEEYLTRSVALAARSATGSTMTIDYLNARQQR